MPPPRQPQRRQITGPGFGVSLLQGLVGSVQEQQKQGQAGRQAIALVQEQERLKRETTTLTEKSKQLRALELIFAEQEAKQQFPAAPDAEEQAQQRALNLITKIAQPQFGAGRIGPATEGQATTRGTRQRELAGLQSFFGKKPQVPFAEKLLQTQALSGARAQGQQDIRGERERVLDENKLRKDFIGQPEVAEFITVKTQVSSMDALLSRALAGDIDNKIALDQALITMFNKLTDPQSVVRESEFARTPENVPVVNRFVGALQKLTKGGAGLTDSDRVALVQGAKIILDERGKTFNESLASATSLADRAGFDVGTVTRDLQPHQPLLPGQDTTKNFSSVQEAEAANLPAGTIITINGRRARVD